MNLIYRTLAVFFLFQDGGKGGGGINTLSLDKIWQAICGITLYKHFIKEHSCFFVWSFWHFDCFSEGMAF